MAKSRAQIQKEYRERKKQQMGEEYKEKERKRAKKYYTPTADLDKTAQKKRREKIRLQVQKFRTERKQQSRLAKKAEEEYIAADSHGLRSSNNPNNPSLPLIVDFNFQKGKNMARKRISRQVASLNRKLKKVSAEKEEFRTQNERLKKRLQRTNKKSGSSDNMTLTDSGSTSSPDLNDGQTTSTPALTPRRKTMEEIRSSGISPSTLPKPIRRKLLASNILSNEIRAAADQNKNKNEVLRNVVSGRIAKKYRNIKLISEMTGLNRKRLGMGFSKTMTIPMRKRSTNIRDALAKKVDFFLSRDDNSRMLPGKKDGKGIVQRRVLNDYMKNLHLKFLAEFPEIKVSAGIFSKLRPQHIRLCNFLSKSTCLCSKHQNFALKCKCLQNLKVCNITNPDSFIRSKDEEEVNSILDQIDDDTVTFSQWKRVKIDVGGKVKEKTRLVSVEVPTDEFKTIFKSEIESFREHVSRVKSQYKAVKDLKEKLLPGQVILQMDFAEDYHCQNTDEVQNAYFGAANVTIFPVVAYYKQQQTDQELSVQSFAIISNEESHDASAVYAFLQKLLPVVKELVPETKQVFYWTDSPTSQFRNKSVFQIISKHESEFGCKANWNYFEAGHGKGPCDGIGGTVKRLADDAVTQSKVVIQDPFDFFSWSQETQHESKIKYLFVSSDETKACKKLLQERAETLKAVPGTMKVHAVNGSEENKVVVRNVSCFCNGCFPAMQFQESSCCEGWSTHNLQKRKGTKKVVKDPEVIQPEEIEEERFDNQLNLDITGDAEKDCQLEVGDFVAAVYEEDLMPYLGQIVEFDKTDVLITFMESSTSTINLRSTFKWPRNKDEVWVDKSHILCVTPQPEQHGKSARSYTLDKLTLECIQKKYNAWK